MSRIADVPVAAHREPPDAVELGLNPYPTIRGKDAVVSYCRELGVPVTYYLVKRATENRELASHLISKAVVYSERDIYRWLRSMQRGAVSS